MVKKFLIYALCTMVLLAFTPLVSFATDSDGDGAVDVKIQAEAYANAAQEDQGTLVEQNGKNPGKNVIHDKDLSIIENRPLPKKEPVDPDAILKEDDGIPDTGGAVPMASAAYIATFHGWYDAEESMAVLGAINHARMDNGLDPLIYDEYDEVYAMNRAKERAIYNSYTRPDGRAGDEYWSDCHEFFPSTLVENNLLYNYDPNDPVWNPDLETCTPAVINFGDYFSFAIVLTDMELRSYDEPLYCTGYQVFKISVKDTYIDLWPELTDSRDDIVTARSTTKGKTLHYRLFNVNKQSPHNGLYFYQNYSYSSNKRVATINSYGTVKTKGVGAAKLTIKPAKVSGKKYSRWIVVKPTKVTGLKLTKPKKKTIKVSWKKITGASGYQIYRSTKKNSGYKLVKTISKGSTKSWTNKKLKKKKKYYYKVRAYVKFGSKKYYGPFSVVKSKKTK